jgi:serine/threonine protein kinase
MLIDLGLSVSYASHRDYLDPDLAGTPLFRAPECFLGSTKYNYKIDVWSLGLIFYFMITGKYLYEDAILDSIFYYFGTPTNTTWKGVMKLPRWKRFKKQVAQTALLKKQLKNHYHLVSQCLILDPTKRADTHTLLML